MSLKKKTGKNIGYVYVSNIIVMVVGVFTTAVLMHLLDPYDFGIVAIGGILITILRNTETFGIDNAIIQKDESEITEIVLGTGFTMKILIALTLFGLSFIIAPYWGALYDESEIVWVIRFLALNFIISSFSFVPNIKLQKNLDFQKRMIPILGRCFVRSLFVITFAFKGFGFWSLVYADIIATITQSILFNMISPWKIRFYFNRSIAKDLFSFGKWVVLSGILYGTYSVIDNAIIGKLLGISVLGYYLVAYRWGHIVSENIRPAFQSVIYPTFASIKHDTFKLQKSYLESIKYLSFIAFPITLGIIFLGDKFILLIGGEKWEESILPLQILSISGLLRTTNVGGAIFQVIGKPYINTGFTIFTMSFIALLVYPFTLWFDLAGAAIAVVITFALGSIITPLLIRKYIDLPIKKQFAQMFIPCVASLGMGIVIFLFRRVSYVEIIYLNELLEFIVLFFIGLISYFSLLYILTKGSILVDLKFIYNIYK